MHRALRVVQVVNVRWFNATAWYGLFLSRLLKEAGHEVLVLGLPGAESFRHAESMGLAPVGLDLNTANPLRLAALARELHVLLRGFRPHLVNCHRGEGMVLWGMLKGLGHRFALVRTRGDQRPPKANAANRILHGRAADAVIATNSRTARELTEKLRIPEDRVHTILGGVDTARFQFTAQGRARVRAQLGFAANHLVVGLLGRFDKVKGQRELLEAMGRICAEQSFGDARLLLAGYPTSSAGLDDLRAWVARYGMEGRCVITGRHEDVPALISAMDLGVVASQGSEAIARAAFEIMSCGVPLVGTSVGVMPDLLPPGALAPPGDPGALEGLVRGALAESETRDTLRGIALRRMADLSGRDFLRRTLHVYGQAMLRRGVRA